MGLLQKNVCPHCGAEYSALKGSCPKCGARKQPESDRTATAADAVIPNTAAARQEAVNSRWQLIFGLCIIAAVIAAVILLITTTLGGHYNEAPAAATPSQEVSPEPVVTATTEPVATPTIESLQVTFLGQPMTDPPGFTTGVGKTVQLGTTHLPVDVEGTVEWSSSADTVVSVDSTGLCTGVAAGSATVTATLYGLSVKVNVIVTG